MDIERMKQVIAQYKAGHAIFLRDALTADRYYLNENDILFTGATKASERERMKEGEHPLRNADNRVSSDFFALLVNQKAAYTYTAPPLFDIGNKAGNKKLSAFLGDDYAKECKTLCVDASKYGVSWIHIWKEENTYQYAVVDAKEVIPVWSKRLKQKLLGVLRVYQEVDEEDGKTYEIYEYWNDAVCQAYRLEVNATLEEGLQYYLMFDTEFSGKKSFEYVHGIGEVPFFPFFNNNVHIGDLQKIKGHIDAYDKVYSGFLNDLEDIQEVIFILTNYGGADLEEFLKDLKYYKAIKLDNDGDGDHSGVETLSIEIPVEAREKMLLLARKCIFEQGQGVDPDPQNFGNSSGVALKYLYSLLELKAGLQETEFKSGFGRFIRCVCRLLRVSIKDDQIIQTWTRTSVTSDLELAQIAQASAGIISKKTIVKNHPWVENPEEEEAALEEEKQKEQEEFSLYQNAFKQQDPAGGGEENADEEKEEK